MSSHPSDKVIEYYNNSASTMDAAYREEPRGWVLDMIADVRHTLCGRRVLEVACGTGYWTRYAAETAEHITAVDAAPNMIAMARAKDLPADRVELRLGDAYALGEVPGRFDAGLAMQWFSHVPRVRHDEFLTCWHARLGAGAVVFMGDNQQWPGMRDKPYGRPGEADTYELRRLPGHPDCELVKNYFTPAELRAILAPYATGLVIHAGAYWWWLHYTVAG